MLNENDPFDSEIFMNDKYPPSVCLKAFRKFCKPIQAFIISSSLVFAFLNSYNAVRYTSANRYHLMHFVLLMDDSVNINDLEQLKHPVFLGEPTTCSYNNNLFETIDKCVWWRWVDAWVWWNELSGKQTISWPINGTMNSRKKLSLIQLQPFPSPIRPNILSDQNTAEFVNWSILGLSNIHKIPN